MHEITFGVIREPFAVQFRNMGCEVKDGDLDTFEKIDKAISMLFLHSYISDSAMIKLRKKLVDDLLEAVSKLL